MDTVILNMNQDLFKHQRKSFMRTGELYFWTATIHQWQSLLATQPYKDIILQSLQYLHENGKVELFAFVIMPNHVHFIWRMNKMNGKESPHVSFLKHTAHAFKKQLLKEDAGSLSLYAVEAHNKQYEFWQRDSLAVHLYTQKVAYQKLEYIHANPVQEHWQLSKEPADYYYSSARYYETGDNQFLFLKDLRLLF